jgi:hypothetical protein
MAIEEVDICCMSCNTLASRVRNEWIRLNTSHITATQTPWYTCNIDKVGSRLSFEPQQPELIESIVSEAVCSGCGRVLGQYCRAALGAGAEWFMYVYVFQTQNSIRLIRRNRRGKLFYDQTASYLKDVNLQQQVRPAIIVANDHKPTRRNAKSPSAHHKGQEQQSPGANGVYRSNNQLSLCAASEMEENQTMPSLLAQQDVVIKRLSSSLDSLQNRVLALEKAMFDVRTELRVSKNNTLAYSRDTFVDNLQVMIAAVKDAGPRSQELDGLRIENNTLKRQLQSMPMLIEALPEDTRSPSEAPMAAKIGAISHPESARKKRLYAKRKSSALQKALTPSASEQGDQRSMSATPRGTYDDDTQLDGLTALREISAAMYDEAPLETTQSRKRLRRSCAGSDSIDKTLQSQSQGSALIDESLPESIIAAVLEDAALASDTANGADNMIDPALRSSHVPDPSLSVLSSIENPPAPRRTRQSTQPAMNTTTKYDEVHEARIREYKARDALRKRNSRAKSSDKKRKDGDEQFKQDEKIKARDRMVQELMEREEMLENDGDL